MFRYTWFLATEKRDGMVRERREDEVEALVAEAHACRGRCGEPVPAEPNRCCGERADPTIAWEIARAAH